MGSESESLKAGQLATWGAGADQRASLLAPGVLTLPLLEPSECARWLDWIESESDCLAPAPNSMHEHALGLASHAFSPLWDRLLAEVALPLGRSHFEAFHGGELDSHHAYLVNYGPGDDEDLGFHVDDSEVTLNLCLEATGSGSELVMLGPRCDLHRSSPVHAAERLEIEHEPGVAILHAGVHRHQVDPIQRGRRRNLILWCRSSRRRLDPAGRDPISHAAWCGAR